MADSRYTKAGGPAWHLWLLIAVSAAYEAAFVHHGLNRIDEGWTLYAARTLHEGGLLYRDAFFVFPPFHLLPAWLALWLDPQGLVESRILYAAFSTAAAVGVYALGRRVMPPGYALFGALFLALAAPSSHLSHLLFGYRYIVFALLALLAFGRRLDTGDARWMLLAGLAAGVGACFRLTPALSAAAALGVGALVSARRWHDPFRDGAVFAVGALIPLLPTVAWLIASVGAETLWLEVLVRPVAMTDQQSLPVPALTLPDEWTRLGIRNAFVALQFRLYALLYTAYAIGLGVVAWRARRRGERFRPVFLLVLVAFGAIYFARTLGRSDEPHLDSALPPVCLLLAHALSLLPEWRRAFRESRALRVASCAALFLVWSFLWGTDYVLAPERRGRAPIHATGGRIAVKNPLTAAAYDWAVASIRKLSDEDDVILDMTASPILHILSGRNGPGGADLVMPATFLDASEEAALLERVKRRPPAVVVWPRSAFDNQPGRRVGVVAPQLTAWVHDRYVEHGERGRFRLMVPKTVR